MKAIGLCVLWCVAAGLSTFAVETISITATPRYPWNGKVDLKFTIGDDEAVGGYAEPQPGDAAIAGRRLKYVRSVGDAQLNTGVVPGSKNTIELKFAWEDNPAKVNECLFCARGSTTSTSTFTGFLINGRWRFDYNATTGSTNGVPLATKDVPIVVRDVAGTASVDGITRQSYSAASFTVGGPLTLFSSYVDAPGTSTDNHLTGKIYYLKIFGDDGTTLLHDFVPWEKNGVVGMYDMVAKRFVTPNIGTLTCGTKYDTSFTAKDVAGGTNLTMKTLYKSNGTAANVAREQLLPGTYNWVWDATADLTSRWPSYASCVPTSSVVLFKDAQLAAIENFYAVPCGNAVSDKSNRAKGRWIKTDGAGKSVQFAFSDDKYTKCVCVHFEQSGADVAGYAKWARYVDGLGHESEDFDTNSATTQTIATSETTTGYGLIKLEARVSQPDVSVVLDRVVVEGKAEATYYVKFNANGGTGTMANEEFEVGEAKMLTANAFKRAGYTFQGWATSASGSKVYSDKQSVTDLTTGGNTVNLYAVWKESLYMVIDLSGGTSAKSYPVSYLDAVPSGGWGSTYKTTKLVLRKVKKGSNSAGGSMSQDMWVGVFEVTVKQWKLVCGALPSGYSGMSASAYNKADNAPIVGIDFAGYGNTTATLFLNPLKNKTTLSTAALPTHDQWEYACRAGTTSQLNNGKSCNNDNLKGIAWFLQNDYTGKSHPVGMLSPNKWGLYDMHGNADEQIKGTANCRGGSWASVSSCCSVTYKSEYAGGGNMYDGFRVFATGN